MPLPTVHHAEIRLNPQANNSPYKYQVVCSCQWQALATRKDEAEWFRNVHVNRYKFPAEEPSGE